MAVTGPRGIQIADANYVKNRFYLIHQGPDGLIHDAYLPIKAVARRFTLTMALSAITKEASAPQTDTSTRSFQGKTTISTTRLER